MATKKLLGVALLLFVALALLKFISEEGASVHREGEPNHDTVHSKPIHIPDQGKHVVVYYFHTSFRCASCLTMEKVARQVVHEQFARELSDGRLQFVAVDVEKAQNRHYIQDYQLVSKSLVLVEYRDGKEVRFKNLQGIWEQTSLEGLRDYIAREISDFLREDSLQ